ncbi:hypothetical protein [Chryseobacterium shandongense]|uniref:hypothetical protein n=1 Tax=Chryseobacterium shandongense TaxID=1493872 RepID=UPI000F4F55D4|nr:hypothetical protein [Chryseobacterium shandongense]AZA56410.1 hypothetical protein EG350_04050 [Chryseobacterium shandongense]
MYNVSGGIDDVVGSMNDGAGLLGGRDGMGFQRIGKITERLRWGVGRVGRGVRRAIWCWEREFGKSSIWKI